MPTPPIPALDLATPYGLPPARGVVTRTSDGSIVLRLETSALTVSLVITDEAACDLAFALGQAGGMCEAGGHVRGSQAEVADDIRGDRVVGRYLSGCESCVEFCAKEAAE